MSLVLLSELGWSITGLSIGISGAGILLQLISNMNNSITNVKTLMTNIKSYTNNKYDKNILIKLDLDYKIEIIESLISNIDLETKHIDTLDIAINNIIQCIDKIKEQLISLSEKLSYNKSVWLMKSFRSYKIDKYLIELENLDSILDRRVKLLKDIIELNNTSICKEKKSNNYDIIELD